VTGQRASRLAALLPLLAAGCLESPWAPPPAVERACDAQREEPLTCDVACPGQLVMAAAACAQTLQGELDEHRRRCDFIDGSSVRFARPLPLDMSSFGREETAELEIVRDDLRCLWARLDPPPGAGGERTLVGKILLGDRCYQQRVELESEAGPGLPWRPRSVSILCDGTRYRGEGPSVCHSCFDRRCSELPLVSVGAITSADGGFELWLGVGEQKTPLFSCR